MSAVPKSVLIDVARAHLSEQVTSYYEADIEGAQGWKLNIGYTVLHYGTARREWMGPDGLECEEGAAPEIKILTLELITPNGFHALSVDDLSATDRLMYEDEIVAAVEEMRE